MEEWKKVPGFDYAIDISTKEGRCKNLKTGKIIGSYSKRDRRIYWKLYKEKKPYSQQAAVWIAKTFPELIENKWFEGADIDHKDTDRLNNHPSNLRWTTRKENLNNPLTKKNRSSAHLGNKHTEETKKKMSLNRKNDPNISKTVKQYTLNGTFLKEYPSATEAERITGIRHSNISLCCNGKRKCTGKKGGEKYIWKYE